MTCFSREQNKKIKNIDEQALQILYHDKYVALKLHLKKVKISYKYLQFQILLLFFDFLSLSLSLFFTMYLVTKIYKVSEKFQWLQRDLNPQP